MADQQNDEKYKNSRMIGKIKQTNGQYGPFQQIHLDAVNPTKEDGSANTFYKGNLIWYDEETKTNYKVKQMKIKVPQNGMPAAAAAKGYICYVVLDLDDGYQVEVLG